MEPIVLPLAVTSLQISVFLHVTAAVVGFGATFAEALTFPVAMKLSPRHLPYVHRLHLTINRWLASPALVVVLATGMYQVSEGDFDLGDFWISASLAIVVVIGAILGGYFIPTDRRLGRMVEREIADAREGEIVLSDKYQAAARIEGIVGAVSGVLIVVAIYLMVIKPGI